MTEFKPGIYKKYYIQFWIGESVEASDDRLYSFTKKRQAQALIKNPPEFNYPIQAVDKYWALERFYYDDDYPMCGGHWEPINDDIEYNTW